MSLRKRTLIVVFAIFLLLALILSVSLRALLINHFKYEENQQSRLNMQRTLAAFESNYAVLDYFAGDWGKWNQTYDYIDYGGFEYINDNLLESTYTDLRVNIILIMDNEGSVAYAGAYDLEAEQFIRFPPEISQVFVPGEGLLDFDQNLDIRHGLIFIGSEPLLVSVSPILRSNGDGPVKGSFVIGRFFTNESIQQIEKQIQFPVDVVPFSQRQGLENDFLLAKKYFGETTELIYSTPLSNSIMGGYLLIKDVIGQPALILRIEQPRTSARSTDVLLLYLAIGLVASSIIFAVIFYTLIENVILSRVFRLSDEAQTIAKSPDKITHVTVDKKDELTTLAININLMLDSLADAHRDRQLMEQRLRGMVESMNDVILTIDADLKFIHFYGEAIKSYGITADNLSLEMIISLFPQISFEEHLNQVQKALSGERLVYEWSTDIFGKIRYFQISLGPLVEKENINTGVVGVVREISNLIEMELQLRQRFEELSVLYSASRLFLSQQSPYVVQHEICRLSVEHFDVRFAWLGQLNPETKQLEYLASENLPVNRIDSMPLDQLMDVDNQPVLPSLKSKKYVILGRQALTTQSLNAVECPYLLMLPLFWEGGPMMVLNLCSKEKPVLDEEREQFVRSFGNLAELAMANTMLFAEVQKNEVRLQDLSQRLVQVHEDERRWLARELHDEIGQYLTALKLRLSFEDFPSEEDQKRIAHAQELVNELISKVRQMSLDLRPSILDDLGLLPALNWLFDRYTRQTEIRVGFSHQGIERMRFPSNVEITAFRIVQEGLTNVARYAETDYVDVEISLGEDTLFIIIKDNGKGFRPEDLETGRSSGIMGMRERVRLLDGDMQIIAAEGQGTRIEVKLPIEE